MDIGPYLRLTSAIEAALAAFPEKESATNGAALADAYSRYRLMARELIASEQESEFDQLFPEWTEREPSPMDLFEMAGYSAKAKERLAALGGWLKGFTAQAQLEANAQAYAKAKLKEEQGVGF